MKKFLTQAASPLVYSPNSFLRPIAKAALLFLNNPQAFLRTAVSKAKSTRPIPVQSVRSYKNGVLFDFDFSYDPAIKEMYYDIYEVTTIELMKNFLRAGDTFIDVGANIGYLSGVGMGLVGKAGQVHSFEPVPEYYYKLENLRQLNQDYQLIANQIALSDQLGKARIDINRRNNIGFNTMVPGFMRHDARRKTVEVDVCRLDDYIFQNKLDRITLIKIDTEGFEFPILRGLSRCFQNIAFRPPIICEIAPAAYPLMGYEIGQLVDYMSQWAYRAFSVFNTTTLINIAKLKETTNLIFICARS